MEKYQDLGTPELQEKKRSHKKRGGIDFLLSRKTITRKQAFYARQYRSWYDARHKGNRLYSSLGRLMPFSCDYGDIENELLHVMAKEDWYRVVSNELSYRGISSGRHFWDAIDITAIWERPIFEFIPRLQNYGVFIKSESTASRWVKEAFQELAEIIESELEMRKRAAESPLLP